jgi:hypothetical protein
MEKSSINGELVSILLDDRRENGSKMFDDLPVAV